MLVLTLNFLLYFSYLDVISQHYCQRMLALKFLRGDSMIRRNLQLPKNAELLQGTGIAGLNFVSCLMTIGAMILSIFLKSELFILKQFWMPMSQLYSKFKSSTSLSNKSFINSSVLYFFLPRTRLDLTQNLLGWRRQRSC